MAILLPRLMLTIQTTCLALGFVIFMRGFLVLKSPIQGHASWEDVSMEPGVETSIDDHDRLEVTPQFDRLVLVLIDALRADFVLPEQGSNLPQMEFVRTLISNNKTLSFLAKAHPPTVTLPRIKALTTGDVPGFVDVVMNFDSTALEEDNLISQFYSNNKTMVFYGDDTWIRLFPDSFIRQDGTTSFFVTDFTEVDNNVTRHVDSELAADDWQVLILHYLGLDHIGHLAGPYSPLVAPKLREMDDIVKKIYHTLLQQDATTGQSSLLLLCGDHGMSDHGSHGGSSAHEVNTPFVMMSSKWADGTGLPYIDESVNQVDAVPTLALLFGLPIPQNSLGSAILPALHSFSVRQQLAGLYLNAQQLLKVFKENVADFEKESSYQSLQRAISAHTLWIQGGRVEQRAVQVSAKYTASLSAMRGRLSESLTTYDLHAMGVGILMLWIVLLSIVLTKMTRGDTTDNTRSVQTISIALFLCAAYLSAHIVVCTGPNASPLLCDSRPLPVLLSVGGFLLVLACMIQISSTVASLQLTWPKASSMLSLFLVLGTVGHTVSLASSSFVEEEHQTWYLLTTSAELLLALYLSVYTPASCSDKEQTPVKQYAPQNRVDPVNPYEQEYLQIQEISALHAQCFDKTRQRNFETPQNDGNDKDEPEAPETDNKKEDVNAGTGRDRQVVAVVMALAVGRLARSWNRTGDKWSHLPDIGDWLVDGSEKRTLTVLVLLSMCGICALRWHRDVRLGMSNLLLGGTIVVYCFRAANGALELPYIYGHEIEKGILEARAVYSILGTMAVGTALYFYRDTMTVKSNQEERSVTNTDDSNIKPLIDNRRTMLLSHVQLMWILLMLLLVRPHNIPLVFLVNIMETCLTSSLYQVGAIPSWAVTLLYMWMGQACFFFQGNSNSISTVDVSAGYIGLEEFTPGVVTVLLCLSTYAGPIFWIISLLKVLSKRIQFEASKEHKWISVLDEVGLVLLGCRALPLAVYTCLATIQRYHLFVWTVFSPKLLYEGMLTVVTATALLLLQTLYYV